jgi:alkylhydroperoxidase family enzyme
MMPERISPTPYPYAPELQAAFAKVMGGEAEPLRLYRMVARNEGLFQRLAEGGILGPRGLLHLGSMDQSERELVILRTTARAQAGYEWEVHVAYFGRRNGLTPEQIAATCREEIDDVLWSVRQNSILSLVDECVGGFAVSDDTWAKTAGELSPDEIIEMVALTGLYLTVSMLARVARTQSEPDVPRFPGWSAS